MSYVRQKPLRVKVPWRVKQPLGAGDVVARMTRAVGIEPCEPCERRKQWLNQYLQFVGRRR